MDGGWWMEENGWWMMNDWWLMMDDGCWLAGKKKWMMKNKWRPYGLLYIEDEQQDWKLKNHQSHPPEIVGNGVWGSLWTSNPKWIGLGLAEVREGWRKDAMTAIGVVKGWWGEGEGGGGGGCVCKRNNLHFLLVWPDGTIVDGHADNWDWKLDAGINSRLENIAFLSHPSNFWGVCPERKKNKKKQKKFGKSFFFTFWAIARDQSSSTSQSHTRWNAKKEQVAEVRRGHKGYGMCMTWYRRARADLNFFFKLFWFGGFFWWVGWFWGYRVVDCVGGGLCPVQNCFPNG